MDEKAKEGAREEAQRFLEEGSLLKTPFIHKLCPAFLYKAKRNLITMSILHDLQGSSEAKAALNVPPEYDSSEWVAVCAYYAMYMSASAALAKIGYKSKSHAATIAALETFFVQRKLLEEKYLRLMEEARLELENEHMETFRLAKDRREIAQYSVTKETTRAIAEKLRKDAYKFVARLELLIKDLERANERQAEEK